MPRILCLWLPGWPAQRRGVRPAPERNRLEPEPDLDDRFALEALAEDCRRFSPTVGVEESPAPESLFLDVTGLEPHYGSEAALARQILGMLAGRKWRGRLAVAGTLGAAWAVSHYGTSGTLRGASSSAFQIVSDDLEAALRPLPIESLRLTDQVIELLHALGVHRLGQLAGLPRDELLARFGPDLLLRWDQALGRAAEPLPVRPIPPDLHAEVILEHATPHREVLRQLVEGLLERVCRRLQECGQGVLRLACRFQGVQGDPIVIPVGVFEPTANRRHLAGLVELQCDRQPWREPIRAVGLEITATAPLEPRQQELFTPEMFQRQPRQAHALIDRLSGQLGWRQVLRPRLVADAQPERAYTYDPWVELGLQKGTRLGRLLAGRPSLAPAKKESKKRSPQERRPEKNLPPRPLWLIRQPIPLAMVAVAPEGPPSRFTFQGHTHRAAWSCGPERIQTGWWRGQIVGRDYYRVESTTGQRFWVFRRLRDGQWFLHGYFE